MKTKTRYINSHKTLFLFLLLVTSIKINAQYLYVNDIGTSSLQVSQVNDLVLSGSLVPASINYLNLGYSPIEHLGIFLGPHFHRAEVNDFQVKGKGINAAIGTYLFLHPAQNSFYHSKNRKKVGGLFYAKVGFGRSDIENVIRTSRRKILKSTFEYQKVYWDFGVQLISREAKLDFNFKRSQIYFLSAVFIGDYNQERKGRAYAAVVDGSLKDNNTFVDYELNIQADYGKGCFNFTSGIAILLPFRQSNPQVLYQRSRSLYLGFNINLQELSTHLKKR